MAVSRSVASSRKFMKTNKTVGKEIQPSYAPDYVVQVPLKGGVGVLVGDVILTAAHCVDYGEVGAMAMGNTQIADVETCQGCLKAGVLAVEPVSDIAVLGALDEQEWPQEAEDFQRFCTTTQPVVLARSLIQRGELLNVSIRNHDGTWVNGSITVYREDLPILYFQTEEVVQKRASGGPVLDKRGELVGLVSITQKTTSPGLTPCVACPRPLLALPVWLCRKFFGLPIEKPRKLLNTRKPLKS